LPQAAYLLHPDIFAFKAGKESYGMTCHVWPVNYFFHS